MGYLHFLVLVQQLTNEIFDNRDCNRARLFSLVKLIADIPDLSTFTSQQE